MSPEAQRPELPIDTPNHDVLDLTSLSIVQRRAELDELIGDHVSYTVAPEEPVFTPRASEAHLRESSSVRMPSLRERGTRALLAVTMALGGGTAITAVARAQTEPSPTPIVEPGTSPAPDASPTAIPETGQAPICPPAEQIAVAAVAGTGDVNFGPAPSEAPEEELAKLAGEATDEDQGQLDEKALTNNSTTAVIELEMPASGRDFLERLKDEVKQEVEDTDIGDVELAITCLLAEHSNELNKYTQYFDPANTIDETDFKEQLDWIENGYKGDSKATKDLNRAISVADLESSLAGVYAQTDNPELETDLVNTSDIVLSYGLTSIGPEKKRNKYKRIIIDNINATLSGWRFSDS